MADTGHWSATPRNACLAILTAFADLEFQNGGAGAGGTGCVKSIARIAHDTDMETIKLGLHAGLPGLLVFYGAGRVESNTASQRRFNHEMKFRILCLSGNFESRIKRQSGAGDMDSDTAITPGVEELQDWSSRLAVRALQDVDGISKVYIENFDPAQVIEQGLYIGTVDIVATREIDVYDDLISTTLETIGVCHREDGTIVWDDPPADTVPDTDWTYDTGGAGPYDPDDAPE